MMDNFYVVCDVHPLVEGHLLIISKDHLSCAGTFYPELFTEFTALYKKFSDFVKITYGSVSSFEHGITGQTVFHSHVHILPFSAMPEQIVPENKLQPLYTIHDVLRIFRSDGKYLFFSIGDQMWNVDVSIGAPRFFRDRFANALGVPERGNWKTMETNSGLMQHAQNEILSLNNKWKQYSLTYHA